MSRSDCTNFLALAACVRTMLKDCVTIRDLAWRILKSINNQFETIYVVCGTSTEKTIKKCRKLPGSSLHYVLKSLDVRLPADLASFVKVGSNKENLLNLRGHSKSTFTQDSRVLNSTEFQR